MKIFNLLDGFIRSYPLRLQRLGRHFSGVFTSHKTLRNRYFPKSVTDWVMHLILYVTDLLALPEIYQGISFGVKWNIRALETHERHLAESVFNNSIDYKRIWIDNKAVLGPKQFKFAYVSFNTINFYESMSSSIFIHELVHIWQYQKLGSIYLYEALKAQRSKDKYDYGGVEGLYAAMQKKRRFLDFNFEQQGDIIEDGFRLRAKEGQTGFAFQQSIYEYYRNEVTEVDSSLV